METLRGVESYSFRSPSMVAAGRHVAVVAAVILLHLVPLGHRPRAVVDAAATAEPSTPPTRASPHLHPACSRERSRHARAVLDEFFHAVVDKNAFALPPKCPFDRSKDMYLEHERHKEVVRRTQWKSLYSDKVFRSEYYVDKHLDNRHMDKIPPGADVCLADYCDVLQCDHYQAYKHPEARRKTGPGLDHGGGQCDDGKLRGVKHFCEVLMHRCFPTGGGGEAGGDGDDGEVATRLHEYFVRHYCDLLTCEGVSTMFQLLSGHHAEFHRGVYVTMLIVLIVLMALYYLSIYCWTKDGRGTTDLRRAKKETAATRFAARAAGLAKKWPLSLLIGGKRRKHKPY